jgi:hypothetical protein
LISATCRSRSSRTTRHSIDRVHLCRNNLYAGNNDWRELRVEIDNEFQRRRLILDSSR